jgi:hypothetical protein
MDYGLRENFRPRHRRVTVVEEEQAVVPEPEPQPEPAQ